MAGNQIAKLLEEFKKWADEVIRLSQKVVLVFLTDNTDRINGYTLDELKEIIQTEVSKHEDLQDNPHSLTISQISGMLSANIDNLLTPKIHRRDFPITRQSGDTVVGEIGVGEYLIQAGFFSVRGYTVPIQDTVITVLDNTPKQYIKFKISQYVDRDKFIKAEFEIINDGGDSRETSDTSIMGLITQDLSGQFTVQFFNYVAFDGYRVSVEPEGRSIPASNQNNSDVGDIANEWF